MDKNPKTIKEILKNEEIMKDLLYSTKSTFKDS